MKEFDNSASAVMEVEWVLFIEDDDGPDIAFLKLKTSGGKTAPVAIKLSAHAGPTGVEVAAIGYPAKDSRIPDQDVMERIFGNVFDKKWLAPGKITGVTANEIYHDCSTLGGNSGSALIDIETGDAVGLHFAGSFLGRNFAVAASVIRERLEFALNLKEKSPAEEPLVKPADPVEQNSTNSILDLGKIELNIPLNISISLGEVTVSHKNPMVITKTQVGL